MKQNSNQKKRARITRVMKYTRRTIRAMEAPFHQNGAQSEV